MRQSIGFINLASCATAQRLQVPSSRTASLDGRGRRIAAVGCGRAYGAGHDGGCGSSREKGDGGENGEIHDWMCGLGGAVR
jgi:hypothetical protein